MRSDSPIDLNPQIRHTLIYNNDNRLSCQWFDTLFVKSSCLAPGGLSRSTNLTSSTTAQLLLKIVVNSIHFLDHESLRMTRHVKNRKHRTPC